MNNSEKQEFDGAVIDLGAATEVTLGIDDPVMRESLVMPHTRDL